MIGRTAHGEHADRRHHIQRNSPGVQQPVRISSTCVHQRTGTGMAIGRHELRHPRRTVHRYKKATAPPEPVGQGSP